MYAIFYQTNNVVHIKEHYYIHSDNEQENEYVENINESINISHPDKDIGAIEIHVVDEYGAELMDLTIDCINNLSEKSLSSVTDKSGYTIFKELPLASYTVEATHPDYLSLKNSRKTLKLDSDNREVSLMLAHSRTLSVNIVDNESNANIHDASISLFSRKISTESNYSVSDIYVNEFNKRNYHLKMGNIDGKLFTTDNLQYGEYSIVVEANDFLDHEQKLLINKIDNVYTIRLNKYGVIEGSVINESGSPIFLADVNISKKDNNGIMLISNISTQKGLYSFSALPKGTYYLSANHPDYESNRSSETIIKLEKDYEYCDLILKKKKCRISGIVINNFNEKPIKDIRVIAFKEKKIGVNKTFDHKDVYTNDVSDQNGSFEIEVEQGYDYFITIENKDHNWFISNGVYNPITSDKEGFLIPAIDSDISQFFIRLEEVKAIHGVVVDENNNPAPNAMVWATDIDTSSKFPTVTTNTDGLFTYPINFIVNNEKYNAIKFHAIHKDSGVAEGESLPAQNLLGSEIKLVLHKGIGKIYGTVTIDGDIPKTKGFIKVVEAMERLKTSYDKNGRYELYGLTMGESTVVFGSEATDIHYTEINLSTHNNEIEVNVDLKKTGSNFIEGRVFDPEMNPVSNVQVFCKNWNIHFGTICHTDTEGYYRIEDLYDGNYDVYFQSKDQNNYENQLFGIPTGSSNVDIILDKKGCKIQGTLYWIDKKPLLASTFLTLYNVENFMRPIREIPTNESDGSFSFTINQKGDYMVKMDINKRKISGATFFTIDDDAPESLNVDLYLEQDADLMNITGQYMTASNQPVERFRCKVINLENINQNISENCWNGKIRLLLYPGSYKWLLTRICA
jgi:hypothetical protein